MPTQAYLIELVAGAACACLAGIVFALAGILLLGGAP
jgi:hypothetical protein